MPVRSCRRGLAGIGGRTGLRGIALRTGCVGGTGRSYGLDAVSDSGAAGGALTACDVWNTW